MKLAIENFIFPFKSVLIVIMLALPLSAAEQEIWYDANGKPTLVKDVSSGKLRVLSAQEIIALEKPKAQTKKVNPATTEQEVDPEATQPVVATVTPTLSTMVTAPSSNTSIPFHLAPKVYSKNTYYIPRYHYYSPCYSTYPYLSGSVIPRFSNNGYYGPAQYYRPCYYPYHHYYRRNYYRNCGKGFILRYSRPGLSIRARF